MSLPRWRTHSFTVCYWKLGGRCEWGKRGLRPFWTKHPYVVKVGFHMVAGVAEKRPSNVSIKWKQVNTGMSLVFTRETKALIPNNLASFCFTSKDTDALVVYHFGSFVNWRKNNIKRSKLDWHFFDFPQKCSLWVIKNPLVKLTRHPALLIFNYARTLLKTCQ